MAARSDHEDLTIQTINERARVFAWPRLACVATGPGELSRTCDVEEAAVDGECNEALDKPPEASGQCLAWITVPWTPSVFARGAPAASLALARCGFPKAEVQPRYDDGPSVVMGDAFPPPLTVGRCVCL